MTNVTVRSTAAADRERQPKLGDVLTGIARCPHCSVAIPGLILLWHELIQRPNTKYGVWWFAYRCTTCGGVVLAKAFEGQEQNPTLDRLFPSSKTVHEDVPEPARTFLQQAYETLYAPDAAAMVAGSAVDAMLKKLGYAEGSLYDRIDQAVKDNKLTRPMGDWAHEVRLGSNNPRHADEKKPHVSPEEAAQSVEFAEALGYFLFVLTKRIERGTEEAKKASGGEKTE